MRHFAICLIAVWIGLAPSESRAQSLEEQQLVMALLRSLNVASITHNREICGYIVRRPDGRLYSTKQSWGGPATCAMAQVPPDHVIVSSWHTHAAWDPNYDNEVPSTIDVEGDMSRGTNGWVATPAGRLWFIDGGRGTSRQICGPNCLPSDPNLGQDGHAEPAKSYTLDALYRRFGP